ncbi:hypothetical protein MPSEU_000086500 [Mayamaea pseudoterrestris]|nr:hypothetical protein MPSEU_000086500 [Mayamaea pseudoterrestris]
MNRFLASLSSIALLSLFYYSLERKQINAPASFDWKNGVSTTKPEHQMIHEVQPEWQPPLEASSLFSHLAPAIFNTTAQSTAAPMFWHVPKSGGTSMKFFGACLQLIVVDQRGSDASPSLKVIAGRDKRFVNFNSCSVDGLKQAHELGYAAVQPAEVIYSPFILEAIDLLFEETNQAQVFVLLRHPVDRIVSLFYYLQHARWEGAYDPSLKNITLLEYAQELPYDNTLTRILTKKDGDNGNVPLNQDDLELAKYFMMRYVLVGLTDQVDESVDRFGQAFGWQNRPQWTQCRARAQKGQNRFRHPQLTPDDEAYKVLASKHEYDIQLYQFATELFDQQRAMFE